MLEPAAGVAGGDGSQAGGDDRSQSFSRPRHCFAQATFEHGEGVLDGIEVQTVNGQQINRQPLVSILSRTASFLWAARLAITTIWPGRNARQSTSWM